MKGSQATHPAIVMSRTSQVTTVAIEGSLPAHADGELLCERGARLEVRLVPQAIDVLCEAAEEDR
jgi:hypothetical protein